MRSLAVLLRLSDSALPTGGFSHSFGFEQYLSRGDIDDATSFSRWLKAYISTQLTFTDGLLMRMHYEDVCERALADKAMAVAIPAQVRQAGVTMARRIRDIGEDAFQVPVIDVEPAHPALEFARVARHFTVPLDDALLAYMTGAVTTLTVNAVRSIPIGQSAGQRIMTRAYPWIDGACKTVHTLKHDDLGATAPGLEIAQMQHETLRFRTFMS